MTAWNITNTTRTAAFSYHTCTTDATLRAKPKKDKVTRQKQQKAILAVKEYLSYDDPDTDTNTLPECSPNRPPGSNVNTGQATRNNFTKPISFFKLFFTDAIIDTIVKHINAYAWIKKHC